MDDIHEKSEEHNRNKSKLIVFDCMIAYIISNKKTQSSGN